MSFDEVIGFIITILGIIYFMFLQYRAGQSNTEESEANPDEQSEVRQLLRSLNIDVNEETAVRPHRLPPKAPKKREEQEVQPPALYSYVEQPTKRLKERPVTLETTFVAMNDRSYEQDYPIETINLPSVIPLDYSLSSEPSRGKMILSNLAAKNDMIVIHDLLSRPKGLW